jgi:hypothetical protein
MVSGILFTLLIPWLYNPLRARVYQQTVGLTSTCPQRKVNDHSASLGAVPCLGKITAFLILFYVGASLTMEIL